MEQSIWLVSKLLEIMRDHSEVNDIEFIYKGFLNSLHEFELKLNDLNVKFTQAKEIDSIGEYISIYK